MDSSDLESQMLAWQATSPAPFVHVYDAVAVAQAAVEAARQEGAATAIQLCLDLLRSVGSADAHLLDALLMSLEAFSAVPVPEEETRP